MRMQKYGRELDLLLLLSDNGSYTAQQIADRLGITRRHLYNYFEYLRDCGFLLVKSGTRYHIDRSSPFFRRLHESMSLTDDEAEYVCRRMADSEPSDYIAQRVRQKLARTFNIADAANPEQQQRVDLCLSRLKEAIAGRRMVTLHNYSSPHSHSVSDRIVEPYMIMNDGSDVRCHEVRSHQNKTFKLSRIEWVEIIDVPWAFESKHKEVYTDMFMFSGEQRYPIALCMGQLSHNLMLEEYPQSTEFMTPDADGSWTFQADVASFLGIGRFVLGLYDDIQILGCQQFIDYITEKIKRMKE